MLGLLACANLDDLYAAIGGGSIFLDEVENAMSLSGISSSALRWTSIQVYGNNTSNRPGGLAYLAGLISEAGGNILKTVNTTSKNGDFHVRMVLDGLEDNQKAFLKKLFSESRFPLIEIEIA